MTTPPLILCIGGHDPTGGAGIQADIETVTALGGRALTLVTALTEQDTGNVRSLTVTPADPFARQLQTLVDDIRPDAVKLGLLGSVALVEVLRPFLDAFAGPVVLDPVLAAGGGFDLDGGDLGRAVRDQLLPLTTLATPNRAEARRLAAQDDAIAAARELLQAGTAAVLLTGADEADGAEVVNLLLQPGAGDRAFRWPRLPQRYHGSGCTLASACATRLAMGDELAVAVDTAQAFTWRSLDSAEAVGADQWLPVRGR